MNRSESFACFQANLFRVFAHVEINFKPSLQVFNENSLLSRFCGNILYSYTHFETKMTVSPNVLQKNALITCAISRSKNAVWNMPDMVQFDVIPNANKVCKMQIEMKYTALITEWIYIVEWETVRLETVNLI